MAQETLVYHLLFLIFLCITFLPFEFYDPPPSSFALSWKRYLRWWLLPRCELLSFPGSLPCIRVMTLLFAFLLLIRLMSTLFSDWPEELRSRGGSSFLPYNSFLLGGCGRWVPPPALRLSHVELGNGKIWKENLLRLLPGCSFAVWCGDVAGGT